MKIKIYKSEAKKVGAQLISDASYIKNEGNKLNQIANDLTTTWNGQDRMLVQDKLKNTIIPNIQQISSAMEDYGKYLKNVPLEYEKLEAMFEGKSLK